MPSRLAKIRSEPDAVFRPAPGVGPLDVVFVLSFLPQFMHNVSPKNISLSIRVVRVGSVFARHHSVKG